MLQIPGKDEWYMVYHRFTYPKGIAMGKAAGYNREVCIDKLEFNQDGSIKQVHPTHKGVQAVTTNKSCNKANHFKGSCHPSFVGLLRQ